MSGLRHISFLFLFVGAMFLGCKKHLPEITPPPVENESEEGCYTYDTILATCAVGPFYHDLNPACMYPSINPNNPMEFIYYQDKAIYKHDLGSGVTTRLADNIRIIERMDWGAKGWITFSTVQWKVWKLKDDGSESARLTNNPQDLGPEFNSSGDRIIYSRDMQYSVAELENNPELRDQYKMIIIDLVGNPVDSFCRLTSKDECYPWDHCAWSPDGKMFAAPEKGVALYDLQGVRLNKVYQAENGVIEIMDIDWSSDGKNVLFTAFGGDAGWGTIYAVDAQTGPLTVIRQGCENKFYTNISVSPDGLSMLAQKGTAVVDGCDVNITWNIVKMDMDGSNEEVIDLNP